MPLIQVMVLMTVVRLFLMRWPFYDKFLSVLIYSLSKALLSFILTILR